MVTHQYKQAGKRRILAPKAESGIAIEHHVAYRRWSSDYSDERLQIAVDAELVPKPTNDSVLSFLVGPLAARLAMQRTESGIQAGEQKTKAGVRTIPLDGVTLDSLRRHRVAMAEEAMAMGVGWRNDAGLVFVSRSGTRLSESNLRQRIFKPLIQKAGLPTVLRIHDLRHFFASYNLSRGVPVTVVSKVMGHASPAVTHAIYAHCIPGDERSIATTMGGLHAV